MLSENEIRRIVEKVIIEMGKKPQQKEESLVETSENLSDIADVNIKKQVLVPNPKSSEGLYRIKETTPARIGIWRAGPRYKTETVLRFRADHASAIDAVFTNVSDEFIKNMGIFSVKTMCNDKDEHLTRPDLGRKFDEDTIAIIKEKCIQKPQVQIYISDGLSSSAIEANAMDTYLSMVQGLEGYGIRIGTPFFVKYGRCPAMDVISEITSADVTCVLIGERPGLVTSESMSAYIAYKATVGMKEAKRTVVSNIHRGGTPAVEAGAYIADIIKIMLDKKASGIDLKL